MNRKEFIKASCSGVCVALGSGFVMSALLAACKTPLGVVKTSAKNDLVTIPLSEFEHSDYKLARVSDYNYDLAIQKMPDGTFQTLVLMCTHANQPLTKTGDNYYCTLHGSQFNHSGAVTKGPAERHLLQLASKIVNNELSITLNTTI